MQEREGLAVFWRSSDQGCESLSDHDSMSHRERVGRESHTKGEEIMTWTVRDRGKSLSQRLSDRVRHRQGQGQSERDRGRGRARVRHRQGQGQSERDRGRIRVGNRVSV